MIKRDRDEKVQNREFLQYSSDEIPQQELLSTGENSTAQTEKDLEPQ